MARRSKSAAPKLPDLRERVMPDILRRLEAGEGLNAICKSLGMPDRRTVQHWCTQDRLIAERIFEARETGFLDRAERAVHAAKTATDPQLGRLAFDAERWYLGKLSNAFAERPPKIDAQFNTQVNIDGDPFGRIADLMDRAAAAVASRGSSTYRVAHESETGSGGAPGGLDDVAALGGPGLG